MLALLTIAGFAYFAIRLSQSLTEVERLRQRVGRLEEEVRRRTASPPAAATTEVRLPAPSFGGATPDATLTDPDTAHATAEVRPRPDATLAHLDTAHATTARATPAHAPAEVRETLESAIGGRWMLYAGVIVLVLGVGFFLKYAFENDWVTETMRVAFGVAGGVALVTGGVRFARAGYVRYGQILSGAGLVSLYLSFYAAFSFYELIGRAAAFLLLLGVTILAAGLSDRQRSAGMALLAVCGGFLTPFMVGGDQDAQVTLFTYDAILIAGTMYLAHRRGWPRLNAASYALTIFTIAAWASAHYHTHKFLPTEGFLTLFVAMYLYILRENRRSSDPWAPWVTRGLRTAPALYHVASISVLFSHDVPLLLYLILATLAVVGAGARPGGSRIRLWGWLAVALPLFVWLDQHSAPGWLVPGTIVLAAISGMHLLAQLDGLLRRREELTPSDVLLLHLNGIGLFGGAYVLVEDVALARAPAIALALAALNAAVAWMAWRQSKAGLHWLGVAFALAAVAVALRLDGPWVTAAWAAEGAAIAWIGLVTARPWFRYSGAALFGVAVAQWLASAASETPSAFTILLNARTTSGVFLIALLYALAVLHKRHRAVLRNEGKMETAVLLLAASSLTVVLASAEIRAHTTRDATDVRAALTSGMLLSVSWALYAAVLVAVGMWRGYAPIRYFAIALFGLTLGKVFLSDLARLGGIYRVVGFLAVGIVLLVVSFLYQRSRAPAEAAGAADV